MTTPSQNPVFVVGVYRSGTSLLYAVLNRHPQIALMYECDVWDFPRPFAGWRFRGKWLERQEFYNQALSRHRLILGGSLRGLENVRTPEDLYQCHSTSANAVLWGEKSPLYSARLRQLARRYPNGSFILIWRDPTEIYRSIQAAGEKTPYFRRPGMLHRLIYHQETMIRDAARLARTGARICHVNYDQLVDNTGEVCRAVCEFLRVNFDPGMMDLREADLSAVYREPQHEFLRRGIIERQQHSVHRLKPGVTEKLIRFRNRWERLSGQTLCRGSAARLTGEPKLIELSRHKTAGALLHFAEGCKRLSYEFLPLAWLQIYRQFKNWRTAQAARVFQPRTFTRQIAENWITILASYLFLAGVITADVLTGPELSLAFFYVIPVMTLTLMVGSRWGTVMALFSSVAWSATQMPTKWEQYGGLLLAWNSVMRFGVLQVLILLLKWVRTELHSLPERRQ